MAKRYSTAGLAVLFETTPSIDTIVAALDGFELARVETTRSAEPRWADGMPFALVAFRPDVNGYVMIEIADARWPDDMGSPVPEQVELIGAWQMGFFGPFVFPGNLARAAQMAVLCPAAASAADRHRAFVRIRASYILGLPDGASWLPPAYDAVAELRFVTRIARALLEVPGALAYFDPNGETLFDASTIDEYLAFSDREAQAPLELWSNVRMMRGDGHLVMDTIGMEQVGVQDLEACFSEDRVSANDVAAFLRNTSHYLLANGPVVKHGDWTDGPGGRWYAYAATRPIIPGPGPTLRWFLGTVAVPTWARRFLVAPPR